MRPTSDAEESGSSTVSTMPQTRAYQQEMLEESLHNNIIIALDTGSGKTHIAVLRLKIEIDREPQKISWFLAPTVALCEQQRRVIQVAIPVSVGLISGALEPNQWKNAALWQRVISTHRIVVSTPQVLLDALRHGYIILGRDISLMIFDEAHHAVDNDPYNRIMQEFYFITPPRIPHSEVSGSVMNQSTTFETVRPMILGLTASPIFGGNVEKAFEVIERNLDSLIRAPRRNREELAKYVHRPNFKHIIYYPPREPPFSTNLASLESVVSTIDIEDDPYVKSLRKQLEHLRNSAPSSSDYYRVDQKLSKVIQKQNSFTHKGLRDFVRCAGDLCDELGVWAADWYVWAVLNKARAAAAAGPGTIMPTWQNDEKKYLLSILDRISAMPVSYYADDIVDDSSDKVQALVKGLLKEKEETELGNEAYSGLIFVTRRDAVLALTEILTHHPDTKDKFRIGSLLGTSDTSQRHSFLDITTKLRKDSQEDTLMDFKIGEKNLIVSTSVAEEGIDVQACGSVIRWDPPPNIVSWAQSRGRARKQRSSFTLMFEEGSKHQQDVAKWEQVEREMVARYTDPSRGLAKGVDLESFGDDETLEFRVESTGALLTLQSAIPHLAHFCAVIPNLANVDFRPIYDIDPPELPTGWHSFADRSSSLAMPYAGPFGSTVTLPRLLRQEVRIYSTDRVHPTKISAHRHAAFSAYTKLYEVGLLDDHLLPLTDRDEEINELKKDVEKRKGMADVSEQMDPWAPEPSDSWELDVWYATELTIGDLPPLYLFTRSQPGTAGPTLHIPRRASVHVTLRSLETVPLWDERIDQAREYTKRLFWCVCGSRMKWEEDNFSYLLLPVNVETNWDARLSWLAASDVDATRSVQDAFNANGRELGVTFEYPSDLSIVRDGFHFSRAYRFIRWQREPLLPEDEETLREHYFTDIEVSYPLLVVQPFPPRTNFLLPIPARTEPAPPPKTLFLLPEVSAVTLLSKVDTEYALLLPSVLRSLAMSTTMESLRKNLFTSASPLYNISTSLLTVAMTAPQSQERFNYQRLETLGDTVLKFIVSIQLLAENPLWHEGYLSRKKDHAVANVRLANENIKRQLYRWIIRDRMLGKKWIPSYQRDIVEHEQPAWAEMTEVEEVDEKTALKKKRKEELSTKVLADVVESLIGAAYIQGGFDLGYECMKFFDLGMKWNPLSTRVEQLLSGVQETDDFPSKVINVERMLGYTFHRKLLLVEALTHATHQQYMGTISYERMEFLGDAVLDMVVTDYLYHAPGKEYSPGHIHLRKTAMVNAHILAYVCLRSCVDLQSVMPKPDNTGRISIEKENNTVYLYQCLLHSSTQVLEQQTSTFARFRRQQTEIENALQTGTIFPWAALTRLQAPKFYSDMVESLIGAVFLDSNGNLDVARQVMRHLGILPILERIVRDEIDILHPVSRMSMWASKHDKELKYKFLKERGNISCSIEIDGEELEEARATDVHRGRATQEEVKFAAAEKAIQVLHLRDYPLSKKKIKPRKARKATEG